MIKFAKSERIISKPSFENQSMEYHKTRQGYEVKDWGNYDTYTLVAEVELLVFVRRINDNQILYSGKGYSKNKEFLSDLNKNKTLLGMFNKAFYDAFEDSLKSK